jgi:hypothetical protein
MRLPKKLGKNEERALIKIGSHGCSVENLPGRWSTYEKLEARGLVTTVGMPFPLCRKVDSDDQ